ncbi:MAG: YbaB/EbfC family nucleoid-associated protein [Candidatus Promineifilaceae bacterium]
MTKRSYRGKPKKKKSPSPNNLMAQVQQMQEQMASQQDALANETVSVTAGGGAITVVISGHQRVQSIEIQPELADPEEIELLQDMLVAAVNSAIEQSQAMAAERMEGLTGGLDINDLLGGLGGL